VSVLAIMLESVPSLASNASAIMILGYAIIAVPTGIVTVDLAMNPTDGKPELEACENCGHNSPSDYNYCPYCGTEFASNA